MPKLKDELMDKMDVEELEDAEYSEGDFESYNGEIPPTGTELLARVTKMWYTSTQNDDPMLKVLVVAEDNEGTAEEYDGLPCWENYPLTAGAKFKWQPFFDQFGLTIREVKSKTMVDAEDDNIGAPIQKIGTFVPGSDDAVCGIVTKKERYDGKWQAHVQDWLDPDDIEAEEEPEERPAKRSSRAAANSGRKAAPASRGRRAKPEPEEEPEEEEERPKRSSRRSSSTGRTSKASSKPPAKGRGRRQAAQDVEGDDEPPF